MWSSALALVRKDIRLFLRDRTALFFAIALPIMLGAVMGTALGGQMGGGGGGGKPKRIAIVVEDQDGSDASRSLIEALGGADGLRVEVVEDARRPVADGDRAGGIVIPEGYGQSAAAGERPGLTLFRDPAQQIASQVMVFQLAPVLLGQMADSMGSGVMGHVLDLIEFPAAGRDDAESALTTSFESIESIVASLEAANGAEEPDVGEEGGEEGSEGAADQGSDGAGFDPMEALPEFMGLDIQDLSPAREDGLPRSAGASHAFAAMAVMMLLFNLVAAAGTLQDERAEGTLDRLRLTPAAGGAVLIGKVLMTMTLATVQLIVLFTFGAVVYDVPVLEHFPELAITSLVWAFSASGLGLLFATACSTRKQMEGLSTLVILGMSAVGGAWFPREITPDWFQTAGLVTPVAWAMDAFHGILWYGKGIASDAERSGVGLALVVLLAFGAVFIALSAAMYRRHFTSR